MAIRLEAVLSGLRASGYAAPAQVEIVAIAERKAGALLVTADPSLYNERRRLIALAAQHRLPAIYEWRLHAVEGKSQKTCQWRSPPTSNSLST